MTDQLARLDATAQAALVRDGDVSPLELVDAAIARIESTNDRVNAVIHSMFDKARAAATADDLPDGPFRGVPFLLKDLWPASAGDPYHLGNKALKEAEYVHPVDSNLTTAYRRAGFVICGRTNTPELGLVATTEPQAHGPSRNPWNTDHGTGGSSGGSAAAVAAGMVPAANASDGGGSIRIPAAMCGLVGLKPSRGRLSMGPMQDEWGLSTQHVVCHTVRDCAGILDATAESFPGDGVIAPRPGTPWSGQVGAPVEPLRIGLLPRSPRGETHPECERASRDTASLLESLGHHVEEAHPDALDRADELAGHFLPLWVAGAANSLRVLGRMIGRELGPDDVEPSTWMMAEQGRSFSAPDIIAAQASMHTMRRELAAWWADGFDILLSPTTAMPPPVIGELASTAEDPAQALLGSMPYATFTSTFNASGQPAISLPTTRTTDGLPIGVQLVGDYAREDLLLRLAAQIEVEVRWADERAPLHP
ncbi:MAG: amidase [Acidimicrobiia bacterium]|nr:amidase [Acidimicrobiia bacterium]